jgi:hypothetical protein
VSLSKDVALKLLVVVIGLVLTFEPSAALAGPDKDAVKVVIGAVKQGKDLTKAFPGAINARQAASLQRVTNCTALNLMKQPEGYYTVVWDCGSQGALGMQVSVTDAMVTSISTMETDMKPNTRAH